MGIVLATMSLVCVLINPYVVLEAATLHSSYQEAVVRVVYPDTEEELLPDLTGILYAPVNWADPSDEGYHALFYSNPLIPLAPDPDLLKAADGRYYLYPTGGSGFDVYVSDDLVHWTRGGRALAPENVAWGGSRNFWAPGPLEYQDHYFLFYSAEGPDGLKRISVAISESPLGPFKDPLTEPLFNFSYETIDPQVFVDAGHIYLYYVRPGYWTGNFHANAIFGVKLSPDLFTSLIKGEPVDRSTMFETAPRLLLKPDQPWEFDKGFINEAPFVLKHAGKYYMMYSANWFDVRSYGVGYAVSTDPLGPFIKAPENPVLSANIPGVSGPGHNAVVSSPDGTELFVVYHTHMDLDAPGGRRQVAIDRMEFRPDGTLFVDGPSIAPRPVPAGKTLWRDIAQDAEAERKDHGLILFWEKPQLIVSILLHNYSPDPKARWQLLLDDGTLIGEVEADPEPGSSVVIPVPRTVTPGIRVLGPETRVSAMGLPVVANLNISLNGTPLYEGADWPFDFPSYRDYLKLGENTLVVDMVNRRGKQQQYKTTFFHVPVSLALVAEEETSAFVRGEITLTLGTAFLGQELTEVYLRLDPILEGVAEPGALVFVGDACPKAITLDTTKFSDGTYDLVAGVLKTDGTVHEDRSRLVIDNWIFLEDEMLAPQDLGFFGVRKRLKTEAESLGWVFVEDDPERWFGDPNRIHPSGTGEEYLIWHLPNLQGFAFTLYAPDPDVIGRFLEIAVSRDQRHWTLVPYTVDPVEKSADGLWKLEVCGGVPSAGVPWDYVCLTLRETGLTPQAVQLGYARIQAPKISNTD